MLVCCISFMQYIATVPQDAASLHGHISGHLLHPQLVWVNGDSRDVHPAAIKVDEEQHVVGHQSTQREHFGGEKSVPASSVRWVRMKAGPVVVRLRSGAGGRPWRGRTVPIG